MEVPDFVKTILRSAAPTLLTALGLPPPFSNIAATVVSSVLDKYLPGTSGAVADDPKTPSLTPSQVTEVIQKNADNPQLILDLKQAEADLRKYELDAGIRFAEVEVQDRKRAGDFQQATGLAEKTFYGGMAIVWISVVGMLFMIAGSLYITFADFEIDPKKATLTTATFGLIGTAVGFINGIAATIVSFYYGSSQSSKEKGDAIAATARDLGQELARAASRSPTALPLTPSAQSPSAPASDPAAAPTRDAVAAKPAAPGLVGEVLPELTKRHSHFPDSVSWLLGSDGIAIDGAAAQGTAGNPTTVRRLWKDYGELCALSARTYGVPVELIVATIATESSGDPRARRKEPKLNDESVGLMQTLVATARGALGRQSLGGDDLLDPATSIKAGTAYIAQQRGQTHFDPPRVAAAYNAGSLRLDGGSNRWKMLCYPKGTGQHIDRWVCFFNDCMRVAASDNWSAAGTPSFAAALGGGTIAAASLSDLQAPAVRKTSADYPPRPDFLPLKDTAARKAMFGTFDYAADPQPDNREHIRISGDWVANNIVKVKVTDSAVAGSRGPLTIQFHRKAADQLQALWAEWEQANLFDRILTFDGGFVPRFIRGSTTSLSCHAFGCAFDINAGFNRLNTMPPLVGQKGSVRELVEIANKHGFFWGGQFRTRLDGMHFEIARLDA